MAARMDNPIHVQVKIIKLNIVWICFARINRNLYIIYFTWLQDWKTFKTTKLANECITAGGSIHSYKNNKEYCWCTRLESLKCKIQTFQSDCSYGTTRNVEIKRSLSNYKIPSDILKWLIPDASTNLLPHLQWTAIHTP